jgi:hypothetical protein
MVHRNDKSSEDREKKPLDLLVTGFSISHLSTRRGSAALVLESAC